MHIVRDSLWQNIEFSSSLKKIIETSDFLRLNDIKQLGPTYLVYPGATHTRFNHSLGVYHVASRLIEKLLQKGADEFLTKEGIEEFKIASLCHDLGHYPFTHALKELPLEEHEKLTAKIILNSQIASIIEDENLSANNVAAIIDDTIEANNEQVIFFRKLLSGVLDPDKLDYLNRDAFFCGVPYGIQDTDFTLNCINPDKERGINVDSKSIVAIENLLFSKYLMYKTVYWHKDVRIATAMMKKSLFNALSFGDVVPGELYELTDNQLFSLVKNKKNDEIWYPAKKMMNKELFITAFEIPFDSTSKIHKNLENLDFRTEMETKIASELKIASNQLLIDIPENISFESNIWIRDENCEFTKSSTVFSKNTVKSFTESLRKIRVAIDKSIYERNSKNIEKKFKELISCEITSEN